MILGILFGSRLMGGGRRRPPPNPPTPPPIRPSFMPMWSLDLLTALFITQYPQDYLMLSPPNSRVLASFSGHVISNQWFHGLIVMEPNTVTHHSATAQPSPAQPSPPNPSAPQPSPTQPSPAHPAPRLFLVHVSVYQCSE